MVKVFKCHRFASQQVVPVQKEPLSICTVEDKIFVATADCEILVFKVSGGAFSEIKMLHSVSQVEKILYNIYSNYIVTVELKKSWKRLTHSVRVYFNWEKGTNAEAKSRTKVRLAGKSHESSLPIQNMMDIIEMPVDHVTSIAVCRLTGNFAVACDHEVKLCSTVEKTVANTDRTYIDVEVFLELCWHFPVISISLCEEFVVCCSKTEVQGVRVKYVERQHASNRALKHSSQSPIPVQQVPLSKDSNENLHTPSAPSTPQSVISDSFANPEAFLEPLMKDIDAKRRSTLGEVYGGGSNQDLSNVGRTHGSTGTMTTAAGTKLSSPTEALDDEHFQEWNFHQTEGCSSPQTMCLPSLQSKITLAHIHHWPHTLCPPVVSNSSGGNVKSNFVVDTETVVHLNDPKGKEEWISASLIPTHLTVPGQNVHHPQSGTNRMKSFYHSSRTNMCCYVSGSRGGYLYQLSPFFTEISAYKYSDKASKVSCGENHLYVATDKGMETYTSRWACAALESMRPSDKEEQPLLSVHPSVKLDICLCGHEPFMGLIDLTGGKDFLVLLSKVQDPPGSEECAWSLYIIHSIGLVEQFNEMMQFADTIRSTGPASYIHLLQEAHLLLSANVLLDQKKSDDTIQQCLRKVCHLLGDFYAQPDQESWGLCSAYYRSLDIFADVLVAHAKAQTTENNYGKGIIDYLERLLFSDVDDSLLPSKNRANDILEMFFHSAPEKLSRLILFSRLKSYQAEIALKYLSSHLEEKTYSGQPISTIEKLAMIQLCLATCDVEMAHTQQKSIDRLELIDICVRHPKLIQSDLNEFTPLAQLLRRHRSAVLLEVLVEMLDECVISLDSLLVLLKSQDDEDSHHNTHVKQILELVLTDEKRLFLFESIAIHLCEIYITHIREGKDHKDPRPFNHGTKFTLPQGNGYFAPRFSWLDELPPFVGAARMLKPCLYLQVKHIHGHKSEAVTKPLQRSSDSGVRERCSCCRCNESLLKLQSMLCCPHFSEDLAHLVLDNVCTQDNDVKLQDSTHDKEMDDVWNSIVLLCEIKLDIKKAMQRIVDSYPKVVGTFASTCLDGNLTLFSDLMKCLEAVMKNSATASSPHTEEAYVAAYKDLLLKASELFSCAAFMELLPPDGKPFFFLPYLVHNLKLEHLNSLKSKIIDFGSELLSHSN